MLQFDAVISKEIPAIGSDGDDDSEHTCFLFSVAYLEHNMYHMHVCTVPYHIHHMKHRNRKMIDDNNTTKCKLIVLDYSQEGGVVHNKRRGFSDIDVYVNSV